MNNSNVLLELFYSVILPVPRLAGVFFGFIYFSKQNIPAVVKTGIVISISLSLVPYIYADIDISEINDPVSLVSINFKEIILGIVMGVIFTIPFQILNLSGSLFDAFKGAQLPYSGAFLSGGEGTATSSLLGYYIVILMFTSGYFLEVIQYVLLSYKVWPIIDFYPVYDQSDISITFILLNELFSIAVLITAPVIIISILVDVCTLVIAKQLPQLNPTMLVMPVKAIIISGFMILLINKVDFIEYMDFDYYSTLVRKIIT
ncbi:EscT/YscT/HrcT family type III secretion system export apparatus protein [Endozoicomonas sp. SM1973]|uniref:EscT/YscT/HrcT family type III secretion system export apparatus protein n=1 Tax=Spartinivicinus marinus TaxID=2994442 RepID=A0A853IFL4_9GAMM|nr:flagellar biosynthetic protein FliR [Spartinivicinus marinus]MCX4029079.1 flagellar biosynthetic protein FliR [Spartinivicinus marinus]NYZ68771.1 EscT/YscT/HrcT family type III secretion system export apparatus protein [Spartinivicinus marinus]